MPFNHLAANHQSRACLGSNVFSNCELQHMPHSEWLDRRAIRSQRYRVPANQRTCHRGLRYVSRQQQLYVDDSAEQLRSLGLPFNDLAADDQSCAFDGGFAVCGGELCGMPYNSKLDDGKFRSQPDWVCPDRNAHVPVSDSLRLLPCEQQLHAEFYGLLRLPPGSFPEHHDAWWERAEPRCGRIPNYCGAVCIMPFDYHLGCGSLQSQHNRLPADQCPRDSGLLFVPCGRQLFFVGHRPHRLRKFGMPFDNLAADHESLACRGCHLLSDWELQHVPYNIELDHGDVQSRHDGVRLDGVARFPVAHSMRFVPCEQQLHAQFSSLLRLPRCRLAKHCNARGRSAESHYRVVPTRLLGLPYNVSLDRRGI
jgi:hypothetical protein